MLRLDKQSTGTVRKILRPIGRARRSERLFFRIPRLAQAPLQVSGISRFASI